MNNTMKAKLYETEEALVKIRNKLSYDNGTGNLTWKDDGSTNNRVGMTAGSSDKGYHRVWINGRTWMAHRVIWAIYYGKWPDNTIDHIDGDSLNNRISNLRDVTQLENNCNKRPYRGRVFKGVTLKKSKWYVRVTKGGSFKQGGSYACLGLALKRYDELAIYLHGDYARLNFPVDNI